MAKLPVNLKNIITADNLPEGRYRFRITKPKVYPVDKEIDAQGHIVGEQKDDGSHKFGWLRIGFRFVEHPANMVPGPDGNIQSLVGDTKWENISLGMTRSLIELYNAVGVDLEADYDALDGLEIDGVVKNKERKDTGAMESRIVGFRQPIG
jgi:hypothetical protein